MTRKQPAKRRKCLRCGKEISLRMRVDAIYCSYECKDGAMKNRRYLRRKGEAR